MCCLILCERHMSYSEITEENSHNTHENINNSSHNKHNLPWVIIIDDV